MYYGAKIKETSKFKHIHVCTCSMYNFEPTKNMNKNLENEHAMLGLVNRTVPEGMQSFYQRTQT